MVHSNNKAGGTRPPREALLAVRYYDWIAHHARRAPGKVAAIDLASERRFTYAQLDARQRLIKAPLSRALFVFHLPAPTQKNRKEFP